MKILNKINNGIQEIKQIWKGKIFENTIIFLFVTSDCHYLSYRAKYKHTVNDFFNENLVVFPVLRDVTSRT